MSDPDQTLEEQSGNPSEHAQANGESSSRADARGDGPGPPGATAEAARALADALGQDAGQDADEDALSVDVEELVATAAQRDEYLALAQRTQADFENYRKRVAREAAAAQERGAAALAKELLPALDNLDRAIDAAEKDDPLLEGVRLVRSELAAALARAGIECYSPLGEVFDPSLHEAVATAPQPEGGPASGTVVEVYQAGYRSGASVIRPARVLVAA
jgi:molecular chaperone GrpE